MTVNTPQTDILAIPLIPSDLLDKFLNDEVIVFIGNGVSRLGGIASWKDLALSFWNECFQTGKVNYATYSRLKNELTDPLELLSICSEKLGSQNIKDCLKDKISFILEKDKQKLYEIYGYIRDFQAGYVTTNYDSFLEDAPLTSDSLYKEEEKLRKKFEEPIQPLQRVNLNDNLEKHKNKIVYLHGSARSSNKVDNKIILTLNDYLEHYKDQKDKQNGKSFLKNLFNKTCLFIGYGLKEQEILQHIVPPGNLVTHYLLQGMFKDNACILKEYQRYYKSIHIELIPYSLSERGYIQLASVLQDWSKEVRQHRINKYKKLIQTQEDEKNIALIMEQKHGTFK